MERAGTVLVTFETNSVKGCAVVIGLSQENVTQSASLSLSLGTNKTAVVCGMSRLDK